MISINDLVQLDNDLLVGLSALLIGACAALLGVWLHRDKDRPVFWALALTVLISLATGVGLIETWVDHFDTEQVEEDVARMLSTLVGMADQTGDPELRVLVQEQLQSSGGDVNERMQSRLEAEGRESLTPIPDDVRASLWELLKSLPDLLHELGFELWVALAAVIVAGLAAMLGVWIEKDVDAPHTTAIFLSFLILLAATVAIAQTAVDVADSEKMEDDVANMLVALDTIANSGDNDELNQYLAQEMQTQARSNPAVLSKVRETTKSQGGDPDELLARHLPAAELSGMGLERAAQAARSKPKPNVETVECDCPEPLFLGAEGAPLSLELAGGDQRLLVIRDGMPLVFADANASHTDVVSTGRVFRVTAGASVVGPVNLRLEFVPSTVTVTFAPDAVETNSQGVATLDRLVVALNGLSNPVALRITGHSDNVGGAQHNQKLSRIRADGVADYLKSRLDLKRVSVVSEGVGSSAPLVGLASDAGENRRVEIEVSMLSSAPP